MRIKTRLSNRSSNRLIHAVGIGACWLCCGGPVLAEAPPQQDADLRRLEPIRVTVRQHNDPGSRTLITLEELTRIGQAHPAEVINAAPGVNIAMNSGQEHLIALRSPVLTGGAGQGSFLILVDGIPTRAPAFGNVNSLLDIPFETAAGIEIINGPANANYGSNAVHGIINILQAAPDGASSSSVQASASTLQNYRLDSVVSGRAGLVDWKVGGALQHDVGWRDSSGVKQEKATVSMSRDIGTWLLTGNLFAINLNQETAGYVGGEDAYKDRDLVKTNTNPEAFRDAKYARASLRFMRPLDQGFVEATPSVIRQRMEFSQHFLPYNGLETNGQDSIGLQTRYQTQSGHVQWLTGLDAQWAEGFIRETQAEPFGFFPGDDRFPVGVHYDFDVETLSLAAFVQASIAVSDDWRLQTGLRAEHHDYAYQTNTPSGVFVRFRVPADRDDNFDLLLPKFGVVWSGVENNELFFNYSRGERAPQASDLYRIQATQGEAEAEVETLDSFELGWRGTHPRWNLAYNIAAYTMQKENFFFRDADGLNVVDGATDHAGIEAAVGQKRDIGFNWKLGASYAEHTYAFNRTVARASEVIVDGNLVDSAPKWLADLTLGWVFDNGAVHVDASYVGEYYTDAANIHEYPGHLVLDLRTSLKLNERIEAFLTIKNLTDAQYADRADFAFGSERYFPGEPVNAVIGVRLTR